MSSPAPLLVAEFVLRRVIGANDDDGGVFAVGRDNVTEELAPVLVELRGNDLSVFGEERMGWIKDDRVELDSIILEVLFELEDFITGERPLGTLTKKGRSVVRILETKNGSELVKTVVSRLKAEGSVKDFRVITSGG